MTENGSMPKISVEDGSLESRRSLNQIYESWDRGCSRRSKVNLKLRLLWRTLAGLSSGSPQLSNS